MGTRNYFTQEEVVLCAYAAMYDAGDFGGEASIGRLTNRSAASIKMKIQNIAAMLDEAGIRRFSSIPPLTGLPHGRHGRSTNWEIVEPLTRLGKLAFREKCLNIVTRR